jgi:hypothetical protein
VRIAQDCSSISKIPPIDPARDRDLSRLRPVGFATSANTERTRHGATQDAAWRIGWARFEQNLCEIVERCEEPLILPDAPPESGATDIAFAASAVEIDDHVLLYFSQSDQDLRCATIRAK